MSLNRIHLAAGAALALLVPATDAAAQFYERQRFERPRYISSHAAPPARPQSPQVAVRSAAPDARPRPARPVPEPPLSAEDLVAKAEADALLGREPALTAAKQKPDPAVIRAAAARHDAHEKKLASQKAKDEAAAIKRKEADAKARARDEAKKAVMPKPKQDAQRKAAKPKTEMPVRQPDVIVTSAPLVAAPVKPALRMPSADGLPVPRNL